MTIPPQQRPIRIVPLHKPLARPAVPAAARLTYRGGPLLTAVQAVGVFWGTAWQQPPQAAVARQLGEFFKFGVAGAYPGQLPAYGAARQKIGRASFSASGTGTGAAGSQQATDPPIHPLSH